MLAACPYGRRLGKPPFLTCYCTQRGCWSLARSCVCVQQCAQGESVFLRNAPQRLKTTTSPPLRRIVVLPRVPKFSGRQNKASERLPESALDCSDLRQELKYLRFAKAKRNASLLQSQRHIAMAKSHSQKKMYILCTYSTMHQILVASRPLIARRHCEVKQLTLLSPPLLNAFCLLQQRPCARLPMGSWLVALE